MNICKRVSSARTVRIEPTFNCNFISLFSCGPVTLWFFVTQIQFREELKNLDGAGCVTYMYVFVSYIFRFLFRWLTGGQYYVDLDEDENGVSFFTLTVVKEVTAVRCEAQNIRNIDQRTAYISAVKGNKFSNYPGFRFQGALFVEVLGL